MKAEEMCFDFNSLRPSMTAERHAIINRLFGSIEEPYVLHSPFHCDFGSQIHIGHHFVGNYNLTILDEGPVTIGNNVFIGPNSGIYTVTHALDPQQRNEGIMRSLPVTIGNNVWIGAGVTILPGVTIGRQLRDRRRLCSDPVYSRMDTCRRQPMPPATPDYSCGQNYMQFLKSL